MKKQEQFRSVVFGVVLLTGLLAASAAGAVPQNWEAAHQRSQQIEIQHMIYRLGLAIAGLGLVVAARWTRGSCGNRRSEKLRLAILGLVAVASFASYFNFFRFTHGEGFLGPDVYHYYMGSKYFSELGHFELYNCTVAALMDGGVASPGRLPRVRDQRSLEILSPQATLATSQSCRGRMSKERWVAFLNDVGWFHSRFGTRMWPIILEDHGYNPTPIWTAVGGFFTSRIPADTGAFTLAILADRGLVLAAMAAIAWAFGIEAAALAMIVWGTGQLWSYTWVGDSLLRHLWFSTLVVGLCLAKKGKPMAAGALLAFATLLRVFPGAFLLAYVSHAALATYRKRSLDPAHLRLALGAAIATITIVTFSLLGNGMGMAGFSEFGEKMSAFAPQAAENKLGLSSLVWRVWFLATGQLVSNGVGKEFLVNTPGPLAWAGISVLEAIGVITALALFWKVLPRIQAWEAACLGLAIVPIFTSPANYYCSFFIVAVMLGQRSRRAYIYLAACAVLWIVNGLLFYGQARQYTGAALISVAMPLLLVAEMIRMGDEPSSALEADPAAVDAAPQHIRAGATAT
ncbi:MAG: hypothetical protein JRH19_17855 [Deltaproteobacteria bacterium]|nr:hypothetical protein [Deltaproteobacteria bacterium]